MPVSPSLSLRLRCRQYMTLPPHPLCLPQQLPSPPHTPPTSSAVLCCECNPVVFCIRAPGRGSNGLVFAAKVLCLCVVCVRAFQPIALCSGPAQKDLFLHCNVSAQMHSSFSRHCFFAEFLTNTAVSNAPTDQGG